MLKIAVLGSNGFIGSSLYKYLNEKHNVFPISRNTIDLLDPIEVKNFLSNNKFDAIVNCAATMTSSDLLHDARNNFGIFMNFYENRHLFGKFINTASGAEFDRNTDINNAEETEIFNKMPSDSYGWGQNMKSRICVNTESFYNLRIFNCFGLNEPKTRIFPKVLESIHQIEITNDRYFDYFSIQDLCKVVEYFIEYDSEFKDVNCVYQPKFKISEIVKKFCDFHSLNIDIKVASSSDKNYTGNATRLSALGINLDGIENGLKNYKKGLK